MRNSGKKWKCSMEKGTKSIKRKFAAVIERNLNKRGLSNLEEAKICSETEKIGKKDFILKL